MAKSLTLAFQYYPNDWLRTSNITLMTPAQEVTYIRLLCYIWINFDGSIPNNEENNKVILSSKPIKLPSQSGTIQNALIAMPLVNKFHKGLLAFILLKDAYAKFSKIDYQFKNISTHKHIFQK